jgi:hypothetical protein
MACPDKDGVGGLGRSTESRDGQGGKGGESHKSRIGLRSKNKHKVHEPSSRKMTSKRKSI